MRSVKYPICKQFSTTVLSVPIFVALLTLALPVPAAQEKVSTETPCIQAKSPQVCDPFEGQVWHAIEQSWPGTLKFDSKSRKVELQPLGSTPISATYRYTKKTETIGGRPALTGTLEMKSSQGEVSKATYRMEGRRLTLIYPGGNIRDETYLRMTPTEEAAEILRIQKLLTEGRAPSR